jgi:hypothetical protein
MSLGTWERRGDISCCYLIVAGEEAVCFPGTEESVKSFYAAKLTVQLLER